MIQENLFRNYTVKIMDNLIKSLHDELKAVAFKDNSIEKKL